MVGRGPAHTLFFDRNMGRGIPEALRLVRVPVRVVYHDEEFAQDTKDDQWLPVVGARGWSVIRTRQKLPSALHGEVGNRSAQSGSLLPVGRSGSCLGTASLFHAWLR